MKLLLTLLLMMNFAQAEEYACKILSSEESFVVWQDDEGADVPLELRFKDKVVKGEGYFNDDNIEFVASDGRGTLDWRFDDNAGLLVLDGRKEEIYCEYDYQQFEK